MVGQQSWPRRRCVFSSTRALDRLRAVTPGAVLLQQIVPTFGLPDDAYIVVASDRSWKSAAGRERAPATGSSPRPAGRGRASTERPSAVFEGAQDRQARIRASLGDCRRGRETLTAAERAEFS